MDRHNFRDDDSSEAKALIFGIFVRLQNYENETTTTLTNIHKYEISQQILEIHKKVVKLKGHFFTIFFACFDFLKLVGTPVK